ncbi:MAG: hypothetical protein GX490_04595 [Bacilli bacterium]|nr:hypothetical protein [Bacilli bacterium]
MKNVKPIVVIDAKDFYDIKADNVRFNNYLGGYEVAKYLVRNNHKCLVF